MLSSSGFRDGLGERDLQFDRESGEVRERLFLRPELAAYESALRRRIGRLASMADPLLVPICGLEHDRATGRVAVISRHVSGTRLADMLRLAREREIVPDLTIGLFLAAEILTAAHTFHSLSGLPHGALTPDRVIVSPEAEVVLADFAYAEVIEAAQFTPRRLWQEFGIAPFLGEPFSFAADVRQAGLIAIAVMLGRPLETLDPPHGVEALLSEVEDAAVIRGGRLFADPVIGWLRRALGSGGEAPFVSSDAAADACMALLTDRERGAARPSFLQFLLELETVCPAPEVLPEPDIIGVPEEEPEEHVFRPAPLRLVERAPAGEFDTTPDDDAGPIEAAASAEGEAAFESAGTVEPEPLWRVADTEPEPEPVYDSASAFASSSPEPEGASFPSWSSSVEPVSTFETEAVSTVAPEAEVEPDFIGHEEPAPAEEPETWRPSYSALEHAFTSEPEPAPEPGYAAREPEPIFSAAEPVPELPSLETVVPDEGSEAAEPAIAPAAALHGAELKELAIQPAAAAQETETRVNSASPFALLDRLKKRAGFGSTEPAPAPPAPLPIPPPIVPLPPPVAASPAAREPAAVAALAPISVPTPPPIGVLTPSPISVPAGVHVTSAAESPLAPAPIRLKDSSIVKKAPVTIAPRRELSDRPVAIFNHPEEDDSQSGFRIPWKMAAAAVVVLVTGLAANNMGWLGSSGAAAVPPGTLVVETTPPGSEVFIDGERKGVTPTVVEVAPGRHEMKLTRKGAEHAWSIDVASGARRVERLDWTALRQTGGIEVLSNTPGSKVLVDGKLRGETPLVLGDLTPGRHLVVVQGPNGNVRRRVTVIAGETTKLDLAIYSGWVIVSAPIELKIFENGKAIGTAGEGPVMLSAGPHRIELVNELLSFRSSHAVDIAPGEEERLNITPKGRLSVNAIPWAEVFVDGERIGETPFANVAVTLGARELLFKHPEHGERRMAITVTGGEPVQISVDLTRPASP